MTVGQQIDIEQFQAQKQRPNCQNGRYKESQKVKYDGLSKFHNLRSGGLKHPYAIAQGTTTRVPWRALRLNNSASIPINGDTELSDRMALFEVQPAGSRAK
jgi:hypothetical protein